MNIARSIGDFLAFIDAPAILLSVLFALVLPAFWKDGRRFLAATLTVSFACLATGIVQAFNAAYRFARESKLLEEDPAADFATSAIGFNGSLLPALVCVAFVALSWYLRRHFIAWVIAPALAICLSVYYGHLIAPYSLGYNDVKPISQVPVRDLSESSNNNTLRTAPRQAETLPDAENEDPSFDEMLLTVSNKINETTPRRIDQHTTLDSTFVQTGRTFVYVYTLDHVSSANFSQDDLRHQKASEAVNYVCSAQKEMLQEGVRIVHRWRGNDGAVIGDVAVSVSDCQ